MTAPDLHQLIHNLITAATQAGQDTAQGHGLTSNIPVEEAKRRLYTRLEQHGLDGTGWTPEPEFTGCPRCGVEDCPGSSPRGVCDREHVELRRERGLLEQNLSDRADEIAVLLDERDALVLRVEDLERAVLAAQERAQVAAAKVREYELEREAALRYQREQTG